MTNRDHQSAAAPCTPPEALCEGPSNVVDLVTTRRNLKTEDLKTVTPKKQTVFSPLPQFRCIPEGCTLNPERCLVVDPERSTLNAEGSPVVDLVTSTRHQKTKALKTISSKKQTVFSHLPQFRCTSERCTLNAERCS
jgi:hypothetical protein